MDKALERELIGKAQAGDAGAFEALVNGYYKTMFRMAYKFCGNRQDAEDVTQESCIRLARGLRTFKNDSAFTSWLYRLVINTGKDWYRSHNRHPKSDEGLETAPGQRQQRRRPALRETGYRRAAHTARRRT